MGCKPGKYENKVTKYSKSVTVKLQIVYDTIKRERPWYIRFGNKMDTTAKEKYMIEMIKEGHDISEETIAHVVGRCYKIHEFDDGKYICWCGFILTSKEYPLEHMKCRSFHKLNQRLVCHNGGVYYPVDILSNPFGEWQPQKSKVKSEVQEVYNMIREKWPQQWYDDELHKYTLKFLIKNIEKGESLTKDMKQHVIDGCDRDWHMLNDNYRCYSGFLVAKKQFKMGILSADIGGFILSHGVLNYEMNPKFQEQIGIKCIPVPELRFRKYHTSQQVTCEKIGPCMNNAKNVYDRILIRDHIYPKSTERIRLTWQEKYLIDRVISGEDIPNEVISHVLDGCYTWGHLLTDSFACCRGYILKRDLFFLHNVRECFSHHTINQELNCYDGLIYHRGAEVPTGFHPKSSGALGYGNTRKNPEFTELPRLPPRPAPPPPDHLDNQPVQRLVAAVMRQNHAVGNVHQNDNGINVVANEPFERNMARNAQRNAASPPPEVEI